MPDTTEGILFIVGAIFFLIGLIGGGMEVSAIKIPPIGKVARFMVFGMGIFLMGVSLFRLMSPTTLVPATPTPENTPVIVTITLTATETPIPPTVTQALLSATALPSPSATLAPIAESFMVCSSSCLQDGSNAISRFPGGTTKLYSRWSYANIPIGAHYVRYWTNNGLEWVRYDCAWSGPSNGVDEISLTEPGGLHSGTWEVTIEVNEEVILREQVYVDGNWSFWEPAGEFDTCYGRE